MNVQRHATTVLKMIRLLSIPSAEGPISLTYDFSGGGGVYEFV